MTFEDAINEQKELRGLKDFHVSLGGGATPEGLREEFRRLNAKVDEYTSFSEFEREQAKNARLHVIINKLVKLSFKVEPNKESLSKFRDEVFAFTDLIPDVDLEEDIEWMKSNRSRL